MGMYENQFKQILQMWLNWWFVTYGKLRILNLLKYAVSNNSVLDYA